jgi:hypothetical protein
VRLDDGVAGGRLEHLVADLHAEAARGDVAQLVLV